MKRQETKGIKEITQLTIPVEIIQDGEYCVLATNDESEKILGQPIVVQGNTFEQAEKEFWISVKCINQYHSDRSRELDKWKFFQKGPWNEIGGTWFTLLGININFRHGEGMNGGWYIPFTKLNISVHNYWSTKTDAKDNLLS